MSKINLLDIEKKGMIKVVGVINGEDFVKNIPLNKIDKTSKKIKVNFMMNKDNEIASAHKPDDFFDCNEGDIKSITAPTEANLFKSKSQVYNKTATYYNMYSKPKVTSFDTL